MSLVMLRMRKFATAPLQLAATPTFLLGVQYKMAEGGRGAKKSMAELEKEITCAVCLEHYTDPKILPCCHYYCKQCVLRLVQKQGADKPFPCPECRMDITLPKGSVDLLPPAFFINRIKEVHTNFSKVHGQVEAACEMCSLGEKAEAFCRQCAQFVCAECVKSHGRMKVFSSHAISTLDELKEGKASEIAIQEPLKVCEQHDEPMKIYCFDCDSFICRDCIIKDHNGHNHDFIKAVGPKMKKEILEKLNPLREVKATLSCAMKEVAGTKSDVAAQVDQAAAHIEDSFDWFFQVLITKKQALVEEAKTKGAEKLERLSGQEKKFSISAAVIQSVIEYAEQCVEHSCDREIVAVRGEVLSRIDREVKQRFTEDELEPVEEADIGAEVQLEGVQQILESGAKVFQLPMECTQSLDAVPGVQRAIVNEPSEVDMTVKIANGKKIRRKSALVCSLKSVNHGYNLKCKVDPIGKDFYRIQYTPTFYGPDEFLIVTNGQERPENRFSVVVSVRPIRVVTIQSPNYLAVTSRGEMIVIEGLDVIKYDTYGKKLEILNGSDHFADREKYKIGLDNGYINYYSVEPCGIAVDSEDMVFVTASPTAGGTNHNKEELIESKLFKLTHDLRIVNKASFQRIVFGSISVHKNRLLVCEKATILVYTKNLDYIKRIVLSASVHSCIGNIAASDVGTFYVTGSTFSGVSEFTETGELVRSFKRMSSPSSVYVAGDYVYVADLQNHEVAIYNAQGEHVTSFGQWGNDEGDFKYPLVVCVDKDGYIYVCDQVASKVKIFSQAAILQNFTKQ